MFANNQIRGDLSSFRWLQSPLLYHHVSETCGQQLCDVFYASLNFRDVMLAIGKLPPEALPGDVAFQECLLGMEFSGTTGKGDRVMGLVPSKVKLNKSNETRQGVFEHAKNARIQIHPTNAQKLVLAFALY